MTFILDNDTGYDSRKLRRVFTAVVKDVAAVVARTRPGFASARARGILDRTRVRVVHTRKGFMTSGYAYYDGSNATIRLRPGSVDTVQAIWLFRHEVYHLFGIAHENMPVSARHRTEGGYGFVRDRFPKLVASLGTELAEKP